MVAFPQAAPSLEPQVEFMRFCSRCDSEQIFTAVMQCEQGLIGVCRSCGDESLIPYTRTNSEAA